MNGNDFDLLAAECEELTLERDRLRAALERVAEWGDGMLADWDARDLGDLLLEEGLMDACPKPANRNASVPEIPYSLGDKWLRFIWQEGDR